MAGPVSVTVAVAMLSVGCFVLAGITVILAVLPLGGRRNVRAVSSGVPLAATDTSLDIPEAGRPSEVMTALKTELCTQMQARHVAEERAVEADQNAARIQADIDGLLHGTSPSGIALHRRIAASLSAQTTDAHQRLVDQHDKTVASLNNRYDALTKRLDAAEAKNQRLEADLAAAASNERDRLRIIFDTITSQTLSSLPYEQRPAIDGHTRRVREAIWRLDPNHNGHLPALPGTAGVAPVETSTGSGRNPSSPRKGTKRRILGRQSR